jgi:hypothetical protein
VTPVAAVRRPTHRAPAPRLVSPLLAVWPALAGYAATRIVGLVAVWLLAESRGSSLVHELTDSDGRHMLQIAQSGYDLSIEYRPDGSLVHKDSNFHPLYPLLVRVFGWSGLPLSWVALMLSFVAGLVAAWGLYVLGAEIAGRRAGVILAVLWGCLPHAVVQSMAYAESLFTALAVWSLYALVHRRWIVAGALTALAGLARPTAVALVAAVGVASLVAVLQRQDGWRPWLGGAVAPLGLLSWWGYVAVAFDRVDGWFWMQRVGWKTHFDGGGFTVTTVKRLLTTANPFLVNYVVLAVVGVSIVLALLIAADRRVLWPLTVYAIAIMVIVLGAYGYWYAKARLILPAFPLLIPVAMALARGHLGRVVTVLAAAALASAWFGAYVLMVWRWSP